LDMMKISFKLLVLILGLWILLPPKAEAYVDPGSIAILLQLVFATVVGVIITLKKSIWNFVKSIIGWYKNN